MVYSSGPTVVEVPAAVGAGSGGLTPSEVNALRRLLQGAPAEKIAPAKKTPEQSNAADGKPSRVTVVVPADARLWVDNVECPLTSTVRSFDTPALKTGQQYYYNLKIEMVRDGRTVSNTRRAVITPGQPVQVDFNAGALTTASR